MTWRDEAACRGMDTRLFFPGSGEAIPAVVRDTCGRCPVVTECGQEADANLEVGVWGGWTGADRKRARRRDRKQKARAARTVTCSCGQTIHTRADVDQCPTCIELEIGHWYTPRALDESRAVLEGGWTHGTRSTYNEGCRCRPCTAAERAYSRLRMAAYA